VKGFVNGLEPLLIDVRVDLSGGNVGVSQKFLNDAKIGSIFQKMGCEGMSQEVRVDVLIEARSFSAFLDDLANTVWGKWAASNGEKDIRVGFLSHQSVALVVKIAF
jgi:hypothetical protein